MFSFPRLQISRAAVVVGDESAESGLLACPVLWDLAHGESDSLFPPFLTWVKKRMGEKRVREIVCD